MPLEEAGLDAAAAAVREGKTIVLPTDTVYGIGADPFSAEAVQALLDAKHRGQDMPPPVLIAERVMMRSLAASVPEAAKELAHAFWPGPLTLVLPAQRAAGLHLGETRDTIALRVPDHDGARELLRKTGPLAVSSANISGQPAGTDVQGARAQLGDAVAIYLDGGPTPGPEPSTIVDFATDPDGVVLRAGKLSVMQLRAVAPGVRTLEDLEASRSDDETADPASPSGSGESTGETATAPDA